MPAHRVARKTPLITESAPSDIDIERGLPRMTLITETASGDVDRRSENFFCRTGAVDNCCS